MAYQGRILARSPYFITASGTTLESATLYVWIWEGATTSKPLNANYKIFKTPVQAGDDEIIFEISQLIRDEFEHNRDAYTDSLTSFADCLWVETSLVIVDSTGLNPAIDDSYLAVDGYGYFEDGVNPGLNLDDYTIIVEEGEDVRISVPNGEIADEYKVYIGAGTSSVPIAATTTSQNKLEYVTITQTSEVSKIELLLSSVVVQTIYIENIEACQYPSKEVKYYDRNGAMAITYMMAKDTKAIDVKRETYKQDIGYLDTTYTYDNSKHQDRQFNITANEKLTLNSGFVPENQKEVMKQIMLSELVWVDDKPVNVTSNSLEYKTVKNDKLINYTLTFNYAYNEINNVY